MSRKNPKRRWRKSKSAHDFRISNRPVVLSEAEPARIVREFDNITLRPVHGAPVLVAAARDPRAIFLYWSIDWPALFADTVPTDRQVHLRIYQADSGEQQSFAIEPMAGNCYVTVPPRSGPYRVEMGYYQPADVWHSIVTSNEVAMPRGDFAVNRDVDLAAIPIHLKFQHLLDLLGAANGAALAETVSQFQARVVGLNTHELGVYAGAAPLLLTVWLLSQRSRWGQLRPFVRAAFAFGAVALLLAFGEYGGLYLSTRSLRRVARS